MLVAPTASWVTPRRARISGVPSPRPARHGTPNVGRVSFQTRRGISERWVVWTHPPKVKKKDGDGMTKKQLRQMAERAGMTVDEQMSTKQLREAMQRAGVAVETLAKLRAAAKSAGVAVDEQMTKKQLKKKIEEAVNAEKETLAVEGAQKKDKKDKKARKEAADKAAVEKALEKAEKAKKAEKAAATMDEADGLGDAGAVATGDGADDPNLRLKRAIPIVASLLVLWVAAVAVAFDPQTAKTFARVGVSLIKRLATGTKSTDGLAEAFLCVFSILVSRLFLERSTRALYFWWTTTKTSEKTWQQSSLHWFVMEVYAPIEVFLISVASLRCVQAGVEHFGLVVPVTFTLVIDTVVRAVLVLAFSRVFLSWQQRAYQTQAETYDLQGETLKSERLAGIQKLSTIATYVLAAVLGLKVCGVDVGALVTFGGISGLAIGLAGRQILENAFMGLMLYATAPFKSGDEILFSTSQVRISQSPHSASLIAHTRTRRDYSL